MATVMRIVWGKIKPGEWENYKAAYKKACEIAGPIEGLKGRWLVRDQSDEAAAYSITIWETTEALNNYAESDLVKNKLFPMLDPYYVGKYVSNISDIEHEEVY